MKIVIVGGGVMGVSIAFFLACGFSGHGLMHGPVVGKLLGEWVTRGKPETLDARPLQLDRFKKGETIVEPFQI